jgi:hypothetical protein
MFSKGFTAATLASLLACSQLAAAHMEIKEPAPFRSKFNPNVGPEKVDYTNTAPLAGDGSNYPCKGYHKTDLGNKEGKPTATYAPGQSYTFEVTGGAAHNGGSCQVSLSFDQGKTFTVIQSIIGGCPLSSTYPFTIPADAPEGEAIWAWTWSNFSGNREQYMNCAAVMISGSAKKRDASKRREAIKASKRAEAFSALPQVFVANIGNDCRTTEGTNVVFPNPGPNVINNGGPQAPPEGNCGPVAANPLPSPSSGNGGSPPPSSTKEVPSSTAGASLPTAGPVEPPKVTDIPGYVESQLCLRPRSATSERLTTIVPIPNPIKLTTIVPIPNPTQLTNIPIPIVTATVTVTVLPSPQRPSTLSTIKIFTPPAPIPT